MDGLLRRLISSHARPSLIGPPHNPGCGCKRGEIYGGLGGGGGSVVEIVEPQTAPSWTAGPHERGAGREGRRKMKKSFTRWTTRTDLTKGAVTRRSVIGTPLLQAQQAATKAPEPPSFDGDVTADGAKMSVVVVNDLTDLEKYVAAWEDLAAAAVEPNVFYEPWMLMPALRAYGVDRRSLFALVLAPDPARPLGQPLLCGFFPLELRDHYGGISSKLPLKTLSLWRKPEMTYLCAPLLRAGYGREALAAFFDWLDACSHNCSLMEFGFVPGEGPFHHLMVDYLHGHLKFTHVAESFTRALFRPASDAEVYIRSALSRARRKEYRRQERRLAETGRLEYKALGPGADADAWIEQFLEFE